MCDEVEGSSGCCWKGGKVVPVGVFGGGSLYGCMKVGGTMNGFQRFWNGLPGGSEGKGIRAIKRAENKKNKVNKKEWREEMCGEEEGVNEENERR